VRKNFNPAEDSHAGRELPSTAPTYIRNIQTGKSKKESKSPEKAQAVREVSITAPHLFKEHSEGKKRRKKSWY
jgi:hypothetical protein